MDAGNIPTATTAADRYARNIITLAASLGYMFDAYVINIYGVTVTAIIAEFKTDLTMIGIMGSVLVAGYTIGSFAFGMLGDRFGRKITLGISIFAYGIVSSVTGFSQTLTQFAIGRFFTGVGGGGELTVGVPYIVETWGVNKRAGGISFMFGGYAAGVVLSFIVAKLFMGYFGFSWRSLYWFSIVPAMMILAVRLALEESPRYVAMIAELHASGKSRVRFVGAMKIKRIRRLMLWGTLIYASITTIYYIQAFYQIAVMEQSFKLPLSDALYVVGGFSLIMLLGTAFAGIVGDKLPRKVSGATSLIFCGIALWTMYSTHLVDTYFVAGAVVWFNIGFSWVIGMTHVGELFPTEIRGAGFGWSVALGRVPSILAPFAGVFLSARLGVPLAEIMQWSFLVLGFALVTYAFGPETHRTELSDFVHEH